MTRFFFTAFPAKQVFDPVLSYDVNWGLTHPLTFHFDCSTEEGLDVPHHDPNNLKLLKTDIDKLEFEHLRINRLTYVYFMSSKVIPSQS